MLLRLISNINKPSRFLSTASILQNQATADLKQQKSVVIRGEKFDKTEFSNLTPTILELVGRGGYHNNVNHPVGLLVKCIRHHFDWTYRRNRGPVFTHVSDLNPVVCTKQQFDSVLIPKDHVARSRYLGCHKKI